MSDLKTMAHGRWVEILRAAGVPEDALNGRGGRPCPRCGGRDRYSPMPDVAERGAVLCRSCHHAGTDPRAGDGVAALRWWLGVDAAGALRWLSSYLGVIDDDATLVMRRPIERRLSIPSQSIVPERFELLSKVWRQNMRPEYLRRAADLLALPTEPLTRLGVGWSIEHKATTWPMRDDVGGVIGVRLRCPTTARKWALMGSRAGLIYSDDLLSIESLKRLLICEGPSDAAALMSIGFDVVGVPSSGCGGELLDGLCRRMRPAEIVLMADGDDVGIKGMRRLADVLMIVAPVRIVSPPAGVKDVRAWVVSGADRSVIESAIDAASVLSIVMNGGVA
ncbi:MAG: primase-helicase zinc-binding domain-containing protein [Pirellulaceae bacterium]|nr:primase-helicase zinc-binding domain-containing protein [Pirellulaceae bacterium]